MDAIGNVLLQLHNKKKPHLLCKEKCEKHKKGVQGAHGEAPFGSLFGLEICAGLCNHVTQISTKKKWKQMMQKKL